MVLRDPDFPHPFLPVSTLLLLRLVNTVTKDLNCGNGEEVLGVPGEGRPQRQHAVTGYAVAQHQVGQALEDSVRTTDGDVWSILRVANLVPQDPRDSNVGCCCLAAVVVVNRSTVYTVTLGDSRCIIFEDKTSSSVPPPPFSYRRWPSTSSPSLRRGSG